MAKQIKAIKCPNCGSIEKSKLDKDLYHCANCNTDYFLDNDDININVNNRVEYTDNTSYFTKNKTLLIVVTVIAVLVIVSYMFISGISSKSHNAPTHSGNTYVTSTATPSQTLPQTPPKPEPKAITYTQSNKIFYTYLSGDDGIYSFNIAYRTFDRSNNQRNGIYYEIRDVKSGHLIHSELLRPDGNTDNWFFRRFDNQVTYIIYNESTIYAFDENTGNVTDVTSTLFKDRPEFVSGIATVNFTPWGYEDSFYILTNNGQEYFYYPLSNQLYNYNTDYEALQAHFNKLNEKRENVDEPYDRYSYLFEYFGNQKNNPILIKVIYKTKNISRFETFGVSNVENQSKPYKINLQYGEGPIIDDKVLAVDRIFFKPTVVYSNKDELIIRVKNNASPKAYYNLQSLDTNTGDVKWTVKGDEKLDFFSNSSSSGNLEVWSKYNLESRKLFIPYKMGYIVQLDYGQYVLISKQGEVSDIIIYQPESLFTQ